MDTILLVAHLLIALALVVCVLLQRSEGGALGMGGGGAGAGGGGLFSARGTANALTRTTAILAAAFMATSLALAVFASQGRESESIFDKPAQEVQEQVPAAPAEPQVPTSQ